MPNLAMQQNQNLNESELNQLKDFLEKIAPSAMNIEMMDGFFVSLICSPDMVMPSEYLPYVVGKDFLFDSNDEATEILGLMMRHWNAIASTLFKTLKENDLYFSILLEDSDGNTPANDWAHGFMQGVKLRPESWYELMDNEEFGGPMVPIMFLHHEHDEDPELRPEPLTKEKRESIVHSMIAGLPHIYSYFEPHRRAPVQKPLRRTKPKIGRNAQCPCGSGKKYKYCCIDEGPTLH